MLLKYLKLHQFLVLWHELFLTHRNGCVSGGSRNLKISAKKDFFLVLGDKKQISPLLATLEKLLEKSTSAHPG